ncbi:hypothetical protein M514_13386 [Trichuris suis]|uniref:Uncharacterized protein n=1 Tax=Trichuris suis TaxID=68888 RepID=A0A085MV26_9BILA|nr:hypothetical protein M514_13386 [Trichuris suis]
MVSWGHFKRTVLVQFKQCSFCMFREIPPVLVCAIGLISPILENFYPPAKKDRERSTRARLTTAKIMLPVVTQMRDCAITVSR